MNKIKITKWIIVAAGVFFGMAIVGGYYVSHSMCTNEVIAELPSPERDYRAVVFQRDCGALTGFSTQVSVFRSWSFRGNGAGNVFIADSNHGAVPVGQGGGPEARVRWRSPRTLVVSYHRNARVFLAERQVGAVQIEFEPLASR
ncbi:hypothetical protein [Pseudogulbenkiania sp. MAI-1]|uniref:hypothetical protein n=1 Tax=Pseudogulbenkiania sp. MAI-1 TaxID=990370 RepID=UPI00045E9679|nr:hypothetical protein [Pseudogulbenkiania sp. MAI-1]